jgi:uncharacterized membrane protein YjjB (DUF3815 family)
VLIGLTGRVVSRRLRMPPLVMAVSGIAPLLPGLTTYRALFTLVVKEEPGLGVGQLLLALGIGGSLAAGVALGEYLARPVTMGLGRLEGRLAGPRLLGPTDPAPG